MLIRILKYYANFYNTRILKNFAPTTNKFDYTFIYLKTIYQCKTLEKKNDYFSDETRLSAGYRLTVYLLINTYVGKTLYRTTHHTPHRFSNHFERIVFRTATIDIILLYSSLLNTRPKTIYPRHALFFSLLPANGII
jgi:hypothetical protein